MTRKIAAGASWMVGLKLVMRALAMVSTVVMARLLLPSDFGLVALAMSLLAVVELLSAFSFQTVLIQNHRADRSHYDTAWTLTLLLAGAVGLVLALLAIPAAEFYSEPRLQGVIYVVALGTLIGGFENIGVVAFQKELQFHREFLLQLLRKLAGYAVAIPLAFYWRDYRALVAGALADRVASVLLSYVMHPYRPRMSIAAARELLDFSRWLFLNNIIYVVRHRVAGLAIGKIAGAGQLGVFSLGYDVSSLVTSELAAPINRALLPGLAQVSSDLATLREAFFSTLGVIALVGVPAAVGICSIAPDLIPLLFGPKWVGAIPVVQVLSIAGGVSILASSIGPVCIALGRPRLLIVVSGVYVLLLVPLLLILVPASNATGAAAAFLSAAVLSLPVQFAVGLRLLQSRPADVIAVVWRPIVAAAMMYAVLATVVTPAVAELSLAQRIWRLAYECVAGAGCFSLALMTLWWSVGRPKGAETAALDRIRNRRSQRSPR